MQPLHAWDLHRHHDRQSLTAVAQSALAAPRTPGSFLRTLAQRARSFGSPAARPFYSEREGRAYLERFLRDRERRPVRQPWL